MATIIIDSLTSLQSAIGSVQPGDTAQIRGGTYKPTSQLRFTRAGVSGSPITWKAYPGETVIIDGSLLAATGWEPPLLHITASWNIFEGIEVRGNPLGRGIYVSTSDCIFRDVVSHHHAGSGFYCTNNYRNQYINIIGHSNQDPLDASNGGNADGISLESGSDNIVWGSIFYNNSDDGLDTWQSTHNSIENTVCYGNGLFSGNGNGFKLGPGGGDTVRNCVSYGNRACGFTNNSGPGNTIEHCTAANNGTRAFENYDYVNTWRDDIAAGVVSMGAGAVNDHNTWNLSITDPGFISNTPTSPDYLSLRSDSSCRGKASDGTDLGALQYGKRISDLYKEVDMANIFAPGEQKNPKAPISVSVAGLACTAEIFLGPNDTTKVATSGPIAFSSTTSPTNITMPIKMPLVGGIYHVYIDVAYQGVVFLAFVDPTDVIVLTGTVGPPVWS